jgi:hypothetical protein
MSLQNKNIF